MLTLVLCALAHSSKTLAADRAALSERVPAEKAGSLLLPKSAFSIAPEPLALNPSIDVKPGPLIGSSLDDFSSAELRPRKRKSDAAASLQWSSSWTNPPKPLMTIAVPASK